MMYCLHYLKHYVHKTSSYLPSFKHIETPAGIRSLGLALFLAKSRTLHVITCKEHRTVVSGLGNLGYGKWCILVYPQNTYFFAGKMMLWRPKMTQFVEISAPCSQILLSGNLTACYVKPSSTFYNTYIYIYRIIQVSHRPWLPSLGLQTLPVSQAPPGCASCLPNDPARGCIGWHSWHGCPDVATENTPGHTVGHHRCDPWPVQKAPFEWHFFVRHIQTDPKR